MNKELSLEVLGRKLDELAELIEQGAEGSKVKGILREIIPSIASHRRGRGDR
jgi:hypothetical protein